MPEPRWLAALRARLDLERHHVTDTPDYQCADCQKPWPCLLESARLLLMRYDVLSDDDCRAAS